MRQCWCTLITATLSKTGKHKAHPWLIILNVCLMYVLASVICEELLWFPLDLCRQRQRPLIRAFRFSHSLNVKLCESKARRRGGWPPLCEYVWAVVFLSTIALASLPTLAKVDASLGFLMLCCFHSDQGCRLAFCRALLGQQTAPNVCTHPHYISVCVCVNVWVRVSLSECTPEVVCN